MSSDGKGSKTTVWLSAQGLKNIRFEKYENDFTFVVGGFRHSCPRFVAEFISPRVRRLHSIDETISMIDIGVDDVGGEFSQLLSGSIDVSDSTKSFLKSIATALENPELYLGVQEGLSVCNIIGRLLYLSSFESDIRSEVEFFASHFNEIIDHQKGDYKKFMKVGTSTISAILSSSSLKVVSEDSVYEFVRDLCAIDGEMNYLFEFVLFEYLNVSSMRDFTSASSSSSMFFETLNQSIWHRLCDRLVLSVAPPTSSRRLSTPPGRVFALKSNSALEGIIAGLTSSSGGNVHERGLVSITDSSHAGDPYVGKLAADLGNANSHFHSMNSPNQWLCYDFKDSRVSPTHYSIKTYPCGAGSHHLKSWVMEMSNDGLNWTEVDRRVNNGDLNGTSFVGTYSISGQVQESRFVRLRQIGKNQMNCYLMMVSGFELFGTLHH
jgi:hypothetical protein